MGSLTYSVMKLPVFRCPFVLYLSILMVFWICPNILTRATYQIYKGFTSCCTRRNLSLACPTLVPSPVLITYTAFNSSSSRICSASFPSKSSMADYTIVTDDSDPRISYGPDSDTWSPFNVDDTFKFTSHYTSSKNATMTFSYMGGQQSWSSVIPQPRINLAMGLKAKDY